MVKPLFLMGLPKTGTTLLQRVLARHPAISSSSEPWLLLPPLIALQSSPIVAEYGAHSCRLALHRLLDVLPNGRADYLRAIQAFGNSVYNDLVASDSIYFLDKTPRYHLVARDIVSAFPDARFVFIWRNPLSVISSTILHNGDKLSGMRFAEFDVLRGYQNQAAAEKDAGQRGLSLRYEDLVADPDAALGRLMAFLELDLHKEQMSDFAQKRFPGGDRNGLEHRKIETTSLDRWRSVLNKPARRAYALKLLARIEEAPLIAHGYDKQAQIDALQELPVRWSLPAIAEFGHLTAAALYVRVQGQAIQRGRHDALMY